MAVRAAVAVSLAIVFLSLIAIDPGLCADGCRDEGVTASPSDATCCVVCLGLAPVVHAFFISPIESIRSSAPVARSLPEQAIAHPIEHPPQTRI